MLGGLETVSMERRTLCDQFTLACPNDKTAACVCMSACVRDECVYEWECVAEAERVCGVRWSAASQAV